MGVNNVVLAVVYGHCHSLKEFFPIDNVIAQSQNLCWACIIAYHAFAPYSTQQDDVLDVSTNWIEATLKAKMCVNLLKILYVNVSL